MKRKTHICGTLRLDRGVPMVIWDKKCLKKREFTYRHKGQVLVQVWRDKRDVKLDFNITQSRMWDRKEEKER
jgi:hypothetical protein